MSRNGFRVLDSDLHVIEPRDLYERYLFPEATSLFLKLPLSEESKRKILWDNCARLYGFN